MSQPQPMPCNSVTLLISCQVTIRPDTVHCEGTIQVLEHHQEEAWRDVDGTGNYDPTDGNYMRLPSHQESTGRGDADLLHLHHQQ